MNFASLFRHLIVAVLMVGIAAVYILIGFRGLTTPNGMDKAQLAREVARGSYKTKVVRPVAIGQFQEAKGRVPALHEVTRADTFHAPLYPVALGALFKVIGADNFEKFQMGLDDQVYALDRWVMGFNVFWLLVAVYLSYILGRALFDEVIGMSTMVLIGTASFFWQLAETGMSHSLLLALFMAALLCMYKATLYSLRFDKSGFIYGVAAGVFLILMCLTHWMALWILAGYLVYAFFFIRPIGGVASVIVILSALAFAHPVMQNLKHTGHPFGVAFYTLYSGLGVSEDLLMKATSTAIPVDIKAIMLTFISNFLTNLSRVYTYMGMALAAPVFFLACLHHYQGKVLKNRDGEALLDEQGEIDNSHELTVSRMRWAVLSMWLLGSIGMSIYGPGEDEFYSRQLHFLFTPVMTIYGLTMIAVLWNRAPFIKGVTYKYAYLWIMLILGAGPMLFTLPQFALRALQGATAKSTWPPYNAAATNRLLNAAIPKDHYVFSDQPWATAWYADRPAIWTPRLYETAQFIEQIAAAQKLPIAGITTSPVAVGADSLFESAGQSGEFFGLGLDSWVPIITQDNSKMGELAKSTKAGSGIYATYQYPLPYSGSLLTYYSRDEIDLDEFAAQVERERAEKANR